MSQRSNRNVNKSRKDIKEGLFSSSSRRQKSLGFRPTTTKRDSLLATDSLNKEVKVQA
jgi:hypothetical protein